MTGWPLHDPVVQSAISKVLERSERQEDLGQLEATFVDPGIAIRLMSDNNQIVYGRRGTGKTHVLKVLKRQADAAEGQLPVYIDMRTLGSSSVWEDSGQAAFVRVSNLLRDVVAEIHNALLEYATRPEVDPPGHVLDSLNRLSDAMMRSALTDEKVMLEEGASTARTDSAAVEATLKPSAPALTLRGGSEDVTAHTMRIVREGRPLERILFREIGEAIQRTLKDAGIRRLVLLLDEWSGVPPELQPLLAEFIKRSCFPYPQLTVKIAAVEHRCCFGVPLSRNNVLGFELSADIASSLELDDYFVYDRDEKGTLAVFAEVLFRHVSAECDSHWITADLSSRSSERPTIEDVRRLLQVREWRNRYLKTEYGIDNAQQFVDAFFASPDAFVELVRAGEGVARDLMSLFQASCFEIVRRRGQQINPAGVREAARDWYVQNKVTNLAADQRAVLERVVNEVVGRHRARTFMFDKRLERSEMLRSLFDLRVIHLVKRGYIATDEAPGTQYNVYTLDYGTYVDALGTDRAPRGDFIRHAGGDHPVVVPFHDDREIKRIVLPPELLEDAVRG